MLVFEISNRWGGLVNFHSERYDMELLAHLRKCWFTLVHISNVVFTVV